MHSAAALTLSTDAREEAQGFRLRIGGGPQAAGKARQAISRLQEELDGPVLDTVRLLVTELITNSVRHAGAAAVELVLLVSLDRVRVEIGNPGAGFKPLVRKRSHDSEGGWGLFLVKRLSDTWGVDHQAGHQRVWFELARV